MDETANLTLPLLMPAQALKHITHNEALARLDALVQLAVKDRTGTPPGSPAEGDRYLVTATALEAWTGWEDSIAHYAGGGWQRIVPRDGFLAWVEDENRLLAFAGSAWTDLASVLSLLGGSLGATDNRLLRSDGAGGATVQGSALSADDSGNLVANSLVVSGAHGTPATTGAYLEYAGSSVCRLGAWRTGASLAILRIATDGGSDAVPVDRLTIGAGLYMTGATGDDRGAGTINATAVYDDNTLLTCMALDRDFLDNGTVDTDFWDNLVPDRVIPAETRTVTVTEEVERDEVVETPIDSGPRRGGLRRERIRRRTTVPKMRRVTVFDSEGQAVGTRELPVTREIETPARVVRRRHELAHRFKTMLETGFDPRDPTAYFGRLREDGALPGMPTRAEWQHGALSTGELLGRLWLATELLALAVMALHQRAEAPAA